MALEIAKKYIDSKLLRAEQFFLGSIEYNKRYYDNLIECYNRYRTLNPQIQGVETLFLNGTYESQIASMQAHLFTQPSAKLATFYFVDPFGVGQTPYAVVPTLLAHDKSELLFNLMYEEFNRFIDSPEFESPLDSMFGEPHWRVLRRVTGSDRKSETVNYYKSRLKSAGAQHVVVFEMRNDRNATDYFLFFATKNLRGLEVMKEAMWRVDPTGAFSFSDYTYSLGPMLITPQADYAQLQNQILHRFRGRRGVPINEIHDFVLTETSFLRFKTEALKPLIERGDCFVERTPGHPSDRLDDTAALTFLSKPGMQTRLF